MKTFLTKKGAELLVSVLGNNGTLKFTKAQFGNGVWPTGDEAALKAEIKGATYSATSDSDIDATKAYYTRSGSGTTADPYVYSRVASPVQADLDEYFEMTPTTVALHQPKVDVSFEANEQTDAATGTVTAEDGFVKLTALFRNNDSNNSSFDAGWHDVEAQVDQFVAFYRRESGLGGVFVPEVQ